MDAALQKQLLDRVYDRRKAATLDLEKQVREALVRGDRARINLFVQQLCALLQTSASPQNHNARNGGLIGLAGIGIALGVEIAPYLEQIVPHVLACFGDPDSKIRYFACESFYNIAKVCKGEILMYFNEIFDALSKLAADSELSVKNGAELLDRLLKDIVCEAAPHYVSQYQDIALIRARQDAASGVAGGSAELDVAREKAHASEAETEEMARNKVFSLARFVPLLSERIYVLSPFTRNYLVSWITVLDSVPDLELVHYLPAFLDGLLKYLSDPNTDVRVATHNVLADFLRECKAAARAQAKAKTAAAIKQRVTSRGTVVDSEANLTEEERIFQEQEEADKEEHFLSGGVGKIGDDEADPEELEQEDEEDAWLPAQAVKIDYSAIMEILVSHISYPDEEIQATTLQWIADFLLAVKEVVVPFTPNLIPAILPSIAHHSPAIQSAANATNANLYRVVQELPAMVPPPTRPSSAADQRGRPSSGKAAERAPDASPNPPSTALFPAVQPTSPQLSPRMQSQPFPTGDTAAEGDGEAAATASGSLNGSVSAGAADPFDLQTTVNMLTLQLIDEHEETRVAALEWLIMLHQRAPHKILAMDDGTFPALLKTLSDPSEEVIRSDLRLLAQISSASEERNDAYFRSFMANLVSLFSTDRRLLETRGSLIIRQLCASLHTERIFRTLAEILERDEDLEFASLMVTNMNMILITSPELADFRRRLKGLDSRDGQQLFSSLYRSWCHNAVATFSLCLLAQAYEHASNLLQIFADLEITVSLLIQIDKLVQLLESPIFTALRLQLLEPERHPYLFKCMYGLLMLLPQSSAFATLRNRLNAVSSMGFLHASQAPRSAYAQGASGASATVSTPGGAGAAGRSKLGEIKWAELLTHFRKVQARHEQARRAGGGALGGGGGSDAALVPGMAGLSTSAYLSNSGSSSRAPSTSRGAPSSRRKASGGGAAALGVPSRLNVNTVSATGGGGGATSSPLNPKHAASQSTSSFFGLHLSGGTGFSHAPSSSSNANVNVPGSSGANRPTSPSARRPTGTSRIISSGAKR